MTPHHFINRQHHHLTSTATLPHPLHTVTITLPHPLHIVTTTAPPITPSYPTSTTPPITLSHPPPSPKEHRHQQRPRLPPDHQDGVDPLSITAHESTLDPSNLSPSTHPPTITPSQAPPIPSLSITAYDSTVNSVSLPEDSSQLHHPHLYQTASVHYIPVTTSHPTDVQGTATSGSGKGGFDGSGGEDRGSGTSGVEDSREIVSYAETSDLFVQSSPSSPPLVEPPSVDTLHSSQYSTWSEDEASISPVTSDGTGAPPPPRQPPVGSDRISTLSLPSTTPNLPATLSPHLFTPSQPPLSTSHLTTSILTPSTATGHSLTSISSLPTPSPIGHVLSGQASSNPTEISERPIGRPNTTGHNQDIDTPCPNLFESGSTVSLPRPNLSIATEDTETMPLGQRTSQDTTPCPDVSMETAQSLDTTPTHATLRLPAEESESDSSTTTSQLPPHTLKSFDISSQLPSPLYPSSLQTMHTSSTSGALSLQEAFLRHRPDFVEHSRKRLEQVKTNASERRIQSSLKDDSTQKRSTIISHSRQKAKKPSEKTERKSPSKLYPLSQPHTSSTNYPPTSRSKDGDGVVGKENRQRAVTFSSPVSCSSHKSGMFSPPQEHKGQHYSIL